MRVAAGPLGSFCGSQLLPIRVPEANVSEEAPLDNRLPPTEEEKAGSHLSQIRMHQVIPAIVPASFLSARWFDDSFLFLFFIQKKNLLSGSRMTLLKILSSQIPIVYDPAEGLPLPCV